MCNDLHRTYAAKFLYKQVQNRESNATNGEWGDKRLVQILKQLNSSPGRDLPLYQP
jgi:hypothetical protein